MFYKRIKRSSPTELSKKLDFCLGRASEQLEQFHAEEKRRKKEEEKLERELEEQRETERIVFRVTIIVLTIVLVLVVAGRLL